MEKNKIVVIFSGGLDSTTLMYEAMERGMIVTSAISFNYGQRHSKELEFAKATCAKFGIKHHLIDLSQTGLVEALSTSDTSLLAGASNEVPDGHYTNLTMKATVVPNRNMIMLSIAGGIAVAEGANNVATGVHSGDHFIYPDCRPGFVAAASEALLQGNEGFGNLQGIIAPFIDGDKTDIAFLALQLNLPFEESWSCYKGGEIHCGRCGTCVERLEAIHDAQERWVRLCPDLSIPQDNTEYEDTTFWVGEVARKKAEDANI